MDKPTTYQVCVYCYHALSDGDDSCALCGDTTTVEAVIVECPKCEGYGRVYNGDDGQCSCFSCNGSGFRFRNNITGEFVPNR